MKGINCFVFFETSGNVRKRYVGWAESEEIRWALNELLLGRGLAQAWENLEDDGVKHAAFEEIQRRWQARGWWDEPQGKSRKDARTTYGRYEPKSR